MNKDQIKFFLSENPGYLKEGKKRLRSVLFRKGFSATLADCAKALKECRSGFIETVTKKESTSKILIYDIETSYNIVSSWRTGYNLNLPHYSVVKERAIICVSYKWLDEDEVYSITWDKDQCDKKLLEEFIPIMNEADFLVAHNGDRFDLKWIKTRALKHGLPMLVNYPQVDTVKIAKKKFYFNSNKLDYISEFLGFGNKLETDHKLWDDIILHKSQRALDEMVEYCNEDVRLLEKVYKKLSSWEYPKMHAGALDHGDKVTSPYNGSKDIELVKTSTTTKGTVKRIMRCTKTGKLFELSDTSYKKFLREKELI